MKNERCYSFINSYVPVSEVTWVASALETMDDVLTPIISEVVVNTDSFCCCGEAVVVKPLLVESKMAAKENVVVK